jgi:hypothetical protein
MQNDIYVNIWHLLHMAIYDNTIDVVKVNYIYNCIGS